MSSTEEGQSQEAEKRQPPRKPRQSVIVRILRALKRQMHKAKSRGKKPETDHQINERMMARWTRRVGFFTAALVATAVISDVIFYGQLQQMMEQAEITKAQLRASLSLTLNAGIVTDKKGAPTWFLTPVWHNAGSTLARNFVGWDCILPLSPKQAGALDFMHPAGKCRNGEFIPVNISPTGDVIQASAPFDANDISNAIAGTITIYAWGHIEYRDIFPSSPIHHANWCVQAIPRWNGKVVVFAFPYFSSKCIHTD